MTSKFLLFVIVTASLTACARDTREKDLKQCAAETRLELSGSRQSKGELAEETTEERHDAVGEMIAACMEKLGYRHDDGSMADQRCVNDVDYNPYCYNKSK